MTAAVDRYGFIAVVPDMSKLSRCNRACLEATGFDCDCSRMGAHHGTDSVGWFERAGEAMVIDLGEIKRATIVYGVRTYDAAPVNYRGEMRGQQYRPDLAGRRSWPVASGFMCACCLSARALVWDRCHAHGFVRAPLLQHLQHPLLGRLDTPPEQGRAIPSANLDTSYYDWCPSFDDDQAAPCSA